MVVDNKKSKSVTPAKAEVGAVAKADQKLSTKEAGIIHFAVFVAIY